MATAKNAIVFNVILLHVILQSVILPNSSTCYAIVSVTGIFAFDQALNFLCVKTS
jgi:hypothetical protein